MIHAMSRRRALAAGTMALVAGLAACSSSSTSSSSGSAGAPTTSPGTGHVVSRGGTPDPCSLVSEAQVSTLLGGPLRLTGRRVVDPAANGATCTWDTGSAVLTITVGEASVLGPLAQHMGQPLAGLGDEAYGSAGTLYFRLGATGVRLIAVGHGAGLITMARGIVDKI